MMNTAKKCEKFPCSKRTPQSCRSEGFLLVTVSYSDYADAVYLFLSSHLHM